jgi:hypothetical protein
VEPRRIDHNARTRWSEAQRQHHAEHVRNALVALLDLGPSTARDVAEATSVSRVTANTLLQELVQLDLAQLAGLRRRTTGPQARVFSVRPAALRFAVAVFRPGELVALSNRCVSAVSRIAAGRHPDLGLIAGALTEAAAPDEPRHVVVAVPDGVSSGWRGEAERELAERLGSAVSVRPHADLAALAESAVGAARGVSDFLLVTGGDEASVKHVVDGSVRHGAHGSAGSLRPLADRAGIEVSEALLPVVTTACLLTDPALVVLSEDLRDLCRPLTDALAEILPTLPEVAVSTVDGDPVLRGALHSANLAVRSDLLRLTSGVAPYDRGSVSRKHAPAPTAVSSSTSPPWARASERAMASPSPAFAPPERLRDRSVR